MEDAVPKLDNWGILESLSELTLSGFGDANVSNEFWVYERPDSPHTSNLLVLLSSWETEIRSCLGDKDLVSLEVSSGSVVLAVLLVRECCQS